MLHQECDACGCCSLCLSCSVALCTQGFKTIAADNAETYRIMPMYSVQSSLIDLELLTPVASVSCKVVHVYHAYQPLTMVCLPAVPPKTSATPGKAAGATRTSSRRSLGSTAQSSVSAIPPNKRAKTSSQSPLGQPCWQQPRGQHPTQLPHSDLNLSQAQGFPKQPHATVQEHAQQQGATAVQASSHTVNGSSVAVQLKEDREKPLQEANYTWVQCDLCNKWRELPKGHAVGAYPTSYRWCKCGVTQLHW